ncbi:MAG: hypothetical protein K9N09_01310 [Candidatus Cloacimonetes bacterium]|nr:hypothetical protein [Candidatus Cloacimonadota bacterium]MCF7812956.1 hypothetical protein [Candidatus Cloacimonadota bacterium]MCF7867312.1 hypothetical protein [Candidatus Cloacimonadota bacterium]MCF7882756.1 hypothetical protein [Candidatus Cloacimonadota bacterium]
MKTFVAEKMPELFWHEIKQNGWESYFSTLNKKEAEIVIIRTQTKANSVFFDQFPKMKMIIRAGTGFDNIDLAEAKGKNIIVCNTPEANAISAYEHTMSFIFALLKQHQISENNLLSGNWKSGLQNNWELSELKALIVGVGRVGTKVATALRFFGANVKGVDPYLTKEEWDDKQIDAISFEEGLSWCNLLSFHCPLTPKSFHMFGGSILAFFQNPLWLINTARGKIVDINAVEQGLRSNKILGFATDVFENEPPDSLDFFKSENVLITPHVGSFTKSAKKRMSLETLQVWKAYISSGKVLNDIAKLKYL